MMAPVDGGGNQAGEVAVPPFELVIAHVLPMTAPLAGGFVIGMLAIVLAARRWLAVSSASGGRNILQSLQRVGVQAILIGLALAWALSQQLPAHLHGVTPATALSGCFWGFAFGMGVGVLWLLRRGLR